MKKILLILLSIILVSSILYVGIGCKEKEEVLSQEETTEEEITEEENTAVTTVSKDTLFAFVLHVPNPFSESIKRGAENAAKDYGAKIEVVTPSKFDTMEQIALFEAEVEKGAKGIGVVAAEAGAWVVPINNATDKGVIITTSNCAEPESRSPLFVGISGYQDGLVLGQAILDNPDAPKKGKIVVASCKPGLPVLDGRTTGVLEVLSSNPDYEIIGPLDSGLSSEATYAFWESAFTANPDMVMAVGSCAFDLPALTMFKQKNPNADFFCASYDLEEAALAGIKEGLVDIACGQGPYVQGYIPMAAIFEHLLNGNPMAEGWVNPGEEIVTKENVDTFIERETNIDVEYEWYKQYIAENITPVWEKAAPWSEFKP